MKPLLQAMKERRLYLDGGMGSMLQAAGLPEGLLPDVWGMENPQAVQGVHRAYLEAGCRLITTNTFGTSAPKLAPYGVTPAQVMTAAVANVRAAMDQAGVTDGYVCADIGPSGKLLRPYGDLDFEAAVGLFAETVRAAAQAGADCILIETMSDLYEMKAAVLAAKENCDLPILASLIFDETGKLLTGGSPRAAVALLEGLGVDVFGLNCGLGPKEMAPVFQALWEDTSTPLLLQPNAGLPRSEGGKAVYDVSPADYARQMRPLAPMATLLGGCCGTTPDHLRALIQATQDIPLPEIPQWDTLLISSYCQAVALDGRDPVIIGERINPTGKKKLQTALREVKEETGLDLISWRWHGIVTFVSDEYPTEYMYLYTSSDYTGGLIDCDEGELEWVPKSRIFELPIWPGDRIFLHLMQTGIPFFSLKLVYRKDRLIAVKLNHRELSPEEIGSLISSPI